MNKELGKGAFVYHKLSDIEIEVEFRTKGNLSDKIFSILGDVKIRKPIYVIDSYIDFNPKTGQLHRLRYIKKDEKEIYFEMQKIPSLNIGHLYEPPEIFLSRNEYQKKIESNNIIVTVEGFREQIKYNGLSFCLDNIKGLGEWTEFEKLVKKESNVKKTERELFDIAKRLGISRYQLTTTPYPEMLINYKK